MISIIITSFEDKELAERAVRAVLNQNVKEKYEVIFVNPKKDVEEYLRKYKINFFRDPGRGKSYALNLVFKKVKGDILILTDGDVFIGKNSINHIIDAFKDEKVGCVAGRVVSLNSKNNMLGYWGHLLFNAGANKIRKKLSNENKFLECTGYLFAFRNMIKEIPLDVAEDSIIPYYFYKKGFKIKYVENAKVYVKNPTNLKDFIKQRKRTANSHVKLKKYAKDFPSVKSFKNEVLFGSLSALGYAKNLKEFIWTIILFKVRLYIWISLFMNNIFKNKEYSDNWERVESAR